MRIYTIHRQAPVSEQGGAEAEIRLIKDGFCWPAALFTVIWALWHGLWVAALVLVGAEVAVGVVLQLAGLDETTQGLVGIGIAVIFGFLANDLRRRKLERQGFAFDDVVIAGGVEDAEWRYFAKQNLEAVAA